MKEISMRLKKIPPGYYSFLVETIYCISPDKVYMVKQENITNDKFSFLQFFLRIPTSRNIHETLITKEFYDGILRDINFINSEIKIQTISEYLFGKDTIRVITENNLINENICIVAVGPEENEEWQNEFQQYHI